MILMVIWWNRYHFLKAIFLGLAQSDFLFHLQPTNQQQVQRFFLSFWILSQKSQEERIKTSFETIETQFLQTSAIQYAQEPKVFGTTSYQSHTPKIPIPSPFRSPRVHKNLINS
jgi:hypothetical protein